jgi:hypothetical protein
MNTLKEILAESIVLIMIFALGYLLIVAASVI